MCQTVAEQKSSGLTWQLVVVFVELVTELVGSDQHTGLGIANILLYRGHPFVSALFVGDSWEVGARGPSLRSVGASIPVVPVSFSDALPAI